MALTELEEVLIDTLKLFGIPARLTSAIIVMLKTEEQQWQLVDFLQPYLKTEESPSKDEVMTEVKKILGAKRN